MHPATREAQITVGVIARSLRAYVNLLEGVHAALPPEPKNIERILEGYLPYKVSVEVRAALEISCKDLRDAADRLERAARMTRRELRREFTPRTDAPPRDPIHGLEDAGGEESSSSSDGSGSESNAADGTLAPPRRRARQRRRPSRRGQA
ncbi:MAG TPA: hypothetical protein VHQ90_03170 [Thermoanaerobaculia bacterium]|nr:hypothetical protein [Thermoanaerobaculia bacterium]